MFELSNKFRKFDLQARLGNDSRLKPENSERIKIARLARKRVKSIWWLIASFAAVLYFFFYLTDIYN